MTAKIVFSFTLWELKESENSLESDQSLFPIIWLVLTGYSSFSTLRVIVHCNCTVNKTRTGKIKRKIRRAKYGYQKMPAKRAQNAIKRPWNLWECLLECIETPLKPFLMLFKGSWGRLSWITLTPVILLKCSWDLLNPIETPAKFLGTSFKGS